MTVFGKLLVFMNLVFSVVTGALIVFVFTTRANWEAAYKDAADKAKTAETAYKNERAAHDNDLKQKTAENVALGQEVTRLRDEVTKAQTDAAAEKDAAAKQVGLNQNASTAQQALQEELKQLKEERAALDKEKNDLRARIVTMQQEVDAQRSIAVNADLQAKNLVQRNSNLLRQVEDLSVRVRDLESTGTSVGGGSGSAGTGASIVDPPPRAAPANVRGKITAVGATGSSYAQVNIGSDSGLSPGNVLTVYKGSEYKGDLKLEKVEPKAAVGKFIPAKRTSKVEVDDNVITSFSGSNN